MQERIFGLSNYLLLTDSPTEDPTSPFQRCFLHPTAKRSHEVLRDIFRNLVRYFAGRVPVGGPVLQCVLPGIRISGKSQGRHIVNKTRLDGHPDHSVDYLGDQ